MRSRAFAGALIAVGLLSASSCRREEAGTAEDAGATGSPLAGLSAAARSGDTAARRAARNALAARNTPRPPLPPPSDSGPLGMHRPAELDEAAGRVVGFLQGKVGFDRIRLADTVTFYVAPEGGGTRTTFAREQLRDRSRWRVRGLMEYSLVPPVRLTNRMTRVGRHLRCGEQSLSWIFPDLARLPHVGTQLAPPDMSSCLQVWNLTFVFDPNAKPPTLVAAVYDQFEW